MVSLCNFPDFLKILLPPIPPQPIPKIPIPKLPKLVLPNLVCDLD